MEAVAACALCLRNKNYWQKCPYSAVRTGNSRTIQYSNVFIRARSFPLAWSLLDISNYAHYVITPCILQCMSVDDSLHVACTHKERSTPKRTLLMRVSLSYQATGQYSVALGQDRFLPDSFMLIIREYCYMTGAGYLVQSCGSI
jgi:hypothetical protein